MYLQIGKRVEYTCRGESVRANHVPITLQPNFYKGRQNKFLRRISSLYIYPSLKAKRLSNDCPQVQCSVQTIDYGIFLKFTEY